MVRDSEDSLLACNKVVEETDCGVLEDADTEMFEDVNADEIERKLEEDVCEAIVARGARRAAVRLRKVDGSILKDRKSRVKLSNSQLKNSGYESLRASSRN